MLRDYYYAIVYAITALAFGLAINPTVWEDYFRAAALAWTVITLVRIFEVALIYHRRYNFLPTEARGRMLKPRRVWGMGIAYAIALVPMIERVFQLLGEGFRWNGFPLLVLTLGAASTWLWPLKRLESELADKEQRKFGAS